MIIRMGKRLGALAVFCVFVASCSGQKPTTYSASSPSSQVKIGKPYVIDGKTYYPEYNPTYDQTGEASWYGPGFHGKYTANGEIFNQDDLTAAHPTLPMAVTGACHQYETTAKA
jgi:rare lipoprotein A